MGGRRARRVTWLVAALLLAPGCSWPAVELPRLDAAAPDGDAAADSGPRDARVLDRDREPDRGAADAAPEESGPMDASDAGSPDACVSCAGDTLASRCSADAGFDCPPDLGSPAYDAWLAHHVHTGTPGCPGCGPYRYDGCYALAGCPETAYIEFSQGTDCGEIFIFDVATKKLVAAEPFCNFLACSGLAVDGCLPSRCFPGLATSAAAPSNVCPPFPDFTIGGTVSGLTSAGLVLEEGKEHLPVASDGTFTFSKTHVLGSPYSVHVFAQPTGQYCATTGATGTVGDGDVTTVAVTCAAATPYTVGGTLTGLPSGDSIVVQNNLTDDVTMTANGGFTFTTSVLEGRRYAVTVSTPPSPPVYCTVSNRSGIVSGDVTDVLVSCFSVPASCGRFSTGFTGTWSNVTADPFSPSLTLSDYVPAGGNATLYVGHGGFLDEYDTSTNVYTPLATAPEKLQTYGSTTWLGGALWSFTSGDVLEYDLSTGAWSTVTTGLLTETNSQTTSDDANNLWSFAGSGGSLLEYNVGSGTVTMPTLTTAFSGLYRQRIAYDGCSGLLYLANGLDFKFYSYDPASGVQTKLKGLPGKLPFRDGFCGDRSGHVFAVTDKASVYQYTISSDAWTALPAGGPTGGSNSACGVGADGYLYATEGSSSVMYRIQLK